jgi:hypothetical protein
MKLPLDLACRGRHDRLRILRGQNSVYPLAGFAF